LRGNVTIVWLIALRKCSFDAVYALS
jgi:hypothetical protein